jgi:hypothetical protein
MTCAGMNHMRRLKLPYLRAVSERINRSGTDLIKNETAKIVRNKGLNIPDIRRKIISTIVTNVTMANSIVKISL